MYLGTQLSRLEGIVVVCPSQSNADVFPSWWDDRSFLLMIDWGMDESGDPKRKKLVVAAVIGQTSQMEKLRSRWLHSLAKFGVDYFHAKDHWNKSATCYHRISIKKREKLLAELVGHMAKYCTATIGLEVDLDDFEKSVTPRFKNSFGSAYGFGVNLLLTMTRLHLGNLGDTHQSINILIEDGHRNSKQAIELISKFKDRPGTILKVASHGLGEKKGHPILQAADLTAYGWWQYVTGGETSIFSELKTGAPRLMAMWLPWDRRSIEAVKEGVDANRLMREQGLQSKPFHDLALW